MREGTIEISEFSQPAKASSAAASRLGVSAGGAIVSVLIHLAVLGPVVWAGSHRAAPIHRDIGTEDSKASHSDEIALQLVTIDDGSADRTVQPPALSPPRLTQVRVANELPELAVDFPDQKLDPSAPSETSDSTANAQLRGQWMGQISARIDRAWLRPRSPIGDERFLCQVRIEQDRTGRITEVALERCNGSPRWQLSLVHAIEAASPLPAPSDPAVFARAMHLSFQAVPIEFAVSVDQYEPDTTAYATDRRQTIQPPGSWQLNN